MISSESGSANVKCPFYKDVTRNTVKCEGLTDCCSIILTFPDRVERRKHMQVFCERKYGNCEVNIMLMKKYEQ